MNAYTSETKIASYKRDVEQHADGKFYTGDLDTNLSKIIDEVKNTKTSMLKTSKKVYVTDHPETILIISLLLFVILIILEKRIRV